jgi:hypothetical protein
LKRKKYDVWREWTVHLFENIFPSHRRLAISSRQIADAGTNTAADNGRSGDAGVARTAANLGWPTQTGHELVHLLQEKRNPYKANCKTSKMKRNRHGQ